MHGRLRYANPPYVDPQYSRDRGPVQTPKVSAQIFRAQFIAYPPSSALGPVDTPPEPDTTNNVFCSAL